MTENRTQEASVLSDTGGDRTATGKGRSGSPHQFQRGLTCRAKGCLGSSLWGSGKDNYACSNCHRCFWAVPDWEKCRG